LAARIVYAPKDFADAKEISDELGTTTVKAKSVSRPLFGGGKTPTVNVSEQRRSLLLPQEVKELGRREEIIFYEGLRPIRCRKNRYYEERRFLKRLLPPPEVPALCIGGAEAQDPPKPATPKPAAQRNVGKADRPIPVSGGESGNTLAPDPETIRPFEAADLARLDTLGLDDFAVSFDSLDIPAGRRLTEAELTRAVETFLDGLTD
jgi:type IV secretion system protein VirD4